VKKGVIVLGGHIQGLNIIRVYGKNNIPTILIDNNRFNLAKHSKYCNKFYKCDNDNLLDFLLDLAKDKKYSGWLIMPTNDFHVKVLSQNKSKLKEYFTIYTPNWDVVSKCYNKIETYTIAKDLNIPIATTIFPKSYDDLLNLNIEYPCIIKPAVMHTFYSKFKKKVFVCNNKDELLENYLLATKFIPKTEIIIQDIIQGSSYNEYSVYMHFRNKKVYNYMVVRRKRQHPADFGNAATFIESVENEELKDLAQKLLTEIDYNGLCEVEFKYDNRDNKFKLLEINPRTWKSHIIAQKAEVPFLISLYEKEINNKDIITTSYKESYLKHILLDTIMIILHKDYRATRFYDKSKTQYMVWDKEDLTPGFFELIYFPLNVLKR